MVYNENNSQVMTISKDNLDVIAQTSAATAMALCSSYCLERKMLRDLNNPKQNLELFKRVDGKFDLTKINWLKIEQIGRPLGSDCKSCFSTLQNILHSCALPRHQTVFLVIGDNGIYNLFLGIYFKDGLAIKRDEKSIIRELNSFIDVNWPGVKTSVQKDAITPIENFKSNRYKRVYSLTGIPSMDLEKNSYPSTIEHLIGGCNSNGEIAYLIVADPVSEDEIDNISYACDEIKGQAESFKEFSLSKSFQQSTSDSFAKTISETIGSTESDSTTKKSMGTIVKTLLGVGVGVAAVAVFPPAVALLGGASITTASAIAGLSLQVANGTGLHVFTSLIPQRTKGRTTSKLSGSSESTTHSLSESYSETLGKKVVNGHIESIIEQLNKQKQRFAKGKAKGMWRTGCYLFTGDNNISSHLQLKSILSGDSSQLEPIRIHDISEFVLDPEADEFSNAVMPFIIPPDLNIVYKGTTDTFIHPFGEGFSQLNTYLTTEELTTMINLPLHSVPGISVVDCSPEFNLDVEENLSDTGAYLHLGSLVSQANVTGLKSMLNLNTLSGHCLVCGVNGSGKTNSVLAILTEMKRRGKPFFIIEPAKTEYVDWALRYNEMHPESSIKVFMPGCGKYTYTLSTGEKKDFIPDVLHINPFEVISKEGCEKRIMSHIDMLKSSFAAAFPMQDILPVVMEHLLYKLYNIDDDERPIDISKFPELANINKLTLSELMDDLGYAKENTMNISAALRTRINSLKYGWKGELLNNQKIGVTYKKQENNIRIKEFTWDDMFSEPIVINLSHAGDDQDRAFIMSLLLQFLYEYRIAESEAGLISFNSNECRHLVVVEEAHRVMSKCENPDLPQYKAGMMFSNFLSEVRAYGQGMLIVDQIPTRLVDDAIKNTNIKIIHKLVAADDSRCMAECVGLTEEQQKFIPKLPVGQAILTGINTGNFKYKNSSGIYLCQINKMK